ncbi:hypothetical protein ONZ51_g3584 [Trametes cubensis]|uniref:Uncharacterized protein n=1 Tax=Trametes cubensis TaxID=1111947 RepID=A0AAD7TXI5_9APHY|nr:hypothetical protein ONZ51_g3584 [Trametes cubensis]
MNETRQEIAYDPNWVGHLIKHIDNQREESLSLLVFDYANLGDTVARTKLAQVSSAKASLDDRFATQEALYCAGARNFCLIDVPPAHEFPKGPKTTRARTAYEAWNPLLREGAKAFIDAHPDATVIIFSSWNLFLLILADPLSYGLPCQGKSRSALFVDGFHSTSAVHAIIAKELLTSLREFAGIDSSDGGYGPTLPHSHLLPVSASH